MTLQASQVRLFILSYFSSDISSTVKCIRAVFILDRLYPMTFDGFEEEKNQDLKKKFYMYKPCENMEIFAEMQRLMG